MISAKTKRYQLPARTFISIGFISVLRRYWWAFLVPPVIVLPAIIWPGALVWLIVAAIVVTGLYLLFWYIQFYGITQLPQGKTLFERYHYEFYNDKFLIKKNEREGMVIQWSQITTAERRPDALLLWVGRFQFFYLPEHIFNSSNDLRWLEAILRRKKLLPEVEKEVVQAGR